MSIRAFADAVYEMGLLIRPLVRLVAEYARNDDDYFLWEVLGWTTPKPITLDHLAVELRLEMIKPIYTHGRRITSWSDAPWTPTAALAFFAQLHGPASERILNHCVNVQIADFKRMVIAGSVDSDYNLGDGRALFTACFVEIRCRWLVAIEG